MSEKVVQKWQNLIMKIRIISDKMIETRKGEEGVIFVVSMKLNN